jgi:hypothetical protein
MDQLNYQQARRIRGESIASLFADQLIAGKGYQEGFKNVINLKSKATAKGFKEKFDPLNIAKALTGGSRLGPAIMGKILGRSKKDIENFAGRAMPIFDKITKISNLESEDDTGTTKSTTVSKKENLNGVKKVLNKILTFLNKSYDNEVRLREKENNFKESNKLQEDKRHNELLKVLAGISGIAGMESTGGTTKNNYLKDFKNKWKSILTKKTANAAATTTIQSVARNQAGAGAKLTIEEAEKAAPSVIKNVIGEAAHVAVTKAIPIVGLSISAISASNRVMKGDFMGAAIDMASGAATTVPYFTLNPFAVGAGTATSIALDLWQISRDVYKQLFGIYPNQEKDSKVRERNMKMIMSIIQTQLPPPQQWNPEKAIPPVEMIPKEIGKTKEQVSKLDTELHKKGITNFDAKRISKELDETKSYLKRLEEANTTINPMAEPPADTKPLSLSTDSTLPIASVLPPVENNLSTEMTASVLPPVENNLSTEMTASVLPQPVENVTNTPPSMTASLDNTINQNINPINQQFLTAQAENNQLNLDSSTTKTIVKKENNNVVQAKSKPSFEPIDISSVRHDDKTLQNSLVKQTVVV